MAGLDGCGKIPDTEIRSPDRPAHRQLLYRLRIAALFIQGSSTFCRGRVATAYGLDGPRIESQWERDFPHMSRPAMRPTQPPVQWVPGLSRG